MVCLYALIFFFFQAEDGIRDLTVTGVRRVLFRSNDEQRTARFRCVVAYVEAATAKPELVEATCEGRILAAPRGSGGFGYDPLFLSNDLGISFAEAPLAAKQRVSHRGRAIRALIEVLVRRST